MKKIFQIVLIVCLSVGYSKGQQLTVATYNLRGDDPRDVGNEWAGRKFMVTDQIQKHKFDLIGMQETNANMVGYLTSVLPKFDSIGVFQKLEPEFYLIKRGYSLKTMVSSGCRPLRILKVRDGTLNLKEFVYGGNSKI